MSDCKPITGELRRYAALLYDKDSAALRRIEDMCDAIDAIHLQLELENAALRERDGYIELPKDANGEYIHEHDTVDWRDHSGTWHERASVVGICAEGCYVMYALDGMVVHVHKSDIRHHHTDTWERILADAMGCEPNEVAEDDDLMKLVARCRALCERTNGGDAE